MIFTISTFVDAIGKRGKNSIVLSEFLPDFRRNIQFPFFHASANTNQSPIIVRACLAHYVFLRFPYMHA